MTNLRRFRFLNTEQSNVKLIKNLNIQVKIAFKVGVKRIIFIIKNFSSYLEQLLTFTSIVILPKKSLHGREGENIEIQKNKKGNGRFFHFILRFKH